MLPDNEAPRWLDEPKNVTKVYWSVWISCFALLLVEPLIHMHAEVSVARVVRLQRHLRLRRLRGAGARRQGLRRILMRPEDYYER